MSSKWRSTAWACCGIPSFRANGWYAPGKGERIRNPSSFPWRTVLSLLCPFAVGALWVTRKVGSGRRRGAIPAEDFLASGRCTIGRRPFKAQKHRALVGGLPGGTALTVRFLLLAELVKFEI